ncbi:MAG: tail fiber domain-containing protein [Balneola sp.]|nr:tail fiber domain-containing protein [Balneola sp.]
MKSILQKIVFSFIVVLVTAVSAYAQVPQGFNFQAVARGATGDILAEQALGVQVSIIKGTEDGNPVYEEAHTVTTNPLGLIQIVIGEGTASEGSDFSAIDFGNDNYFVKLAIDPAGGTEYEDLGTTRLLSVPYALVAQKAVEGGTGTGETITNYSLDVAEGDTAFQVTISGDEGSVNNSAFIGLARTSGTNVGVEGKAHSETGNEGLQVGTYGEALGVGSSSHIGVYGYSQADGGGSSYGSYSRGGGSGKFNFGAFGIARGDGSGEIVPLGEEVDFNFGSYNIAGGFYSSGNLNGNVGVEAQASGENGSRIDFGVISRAIGTGNSPNIGVRAEAFNSPEQNVALEGEANGSTSNLGLRLNVHSGSSNIGMEVNADTAAILNGHSVINGNLTVNGNIFGSVGSGSANGQTLDSLFISTQPEAEYQRNTSFYPGFLRNTDQDGNFVTLSRRALQYGDTDSEGTGFVYNWFNKGGMQVASADYANGERAAGMNGGYFYMDIYQNENFYVPLQFGIQNAAEGGRSWFEMSSLARQESGLGALFNIHISNDPAGNDPSGESSQVTMFGDTSPNFQYGGQSWENNDLAFLNIFGSTPSGDGWYLTNAEIHVASDGTDEWGVVSLKKTNIVGQTSQETILLDGGNGNINISGTLNQSSDERLKKDIRTLDNALDKTMEMRGVSYTWKTDVSNEDPQIGVIAQEVEKIYPEFVRTDENGMKSVNYAQMTAVLIEAVKALNLELQDLKNDNATLQAKVDKQQELEIRLSRIEKLLSSGNGNTPYSLTED